MQLGTWTIPLLPAVAVGVAVVLAVLVGWGVSRARRRSPATVPPVGETVGEDTGPCPEDWTGEAAGGAADPLPPRRTTVADVVAARGADTPAYGARFPTGGWPAEQPYAAPERHHPAGDTTVRTGAVATGVTAAETSEQATGPTPPTGSSTATTALPAVDAVGPRPATTASTPAETTALPLVRPAAEPAPPATDPAEAGATASASSVGGPSAAGQAAAGGSTAATGTDGVADGTAVADGTGTATTDAGTASTAATSSAVTEGSATEVAPGAPVSGPSPAVDTPATPGRRPVGGATTGDAGPAGTTRPRTGPRHAYTPVPTPPAPARTAYDPWAIEPEPGPDPWAAPPAPDPTAALAAPDATAQLAAHEPTTGRERDRTADPRPHDTDPTGAPTTTGEEDTPATYLPDARDIAASTGPDGVAPTAEARPPGSADSALPGPGDVVETVEDVEGLDRERPDDPEHPDDTVDSGPVPPPWSAARSDPDVARSDAGAAPISVAVAQALAAREVHRSRGSIEDGSDPDLDQMPVTDARDRLLSVLLADPAAALGAATELDDTRARIDRLGDVLRRRRADLATAVQRLHASGLTEPQIGRLAGLAADDVRAILDHRTEEDPAGR